MNTFSVEKGSGALTVEAQVILPGDSIVAVFGGGDVPHVGAVAVAFPRPSLKNDGTISASASVICGIGHKEDEIAKKTALRLAAQFNTTAVVSVGLHINDPKPGDFTGILENFEASLEEILAWLRERTSAGKLPIH